MVTNKYGNRLSRKHPTALAFVDETGAIANDRYFGVGLVKCQSPSVLLRAVQHLRDRRHWYTEFKFSSITTRTLSLYETFVDTCVGSGDFQFTCFVADRDVADPVERFGDAWTAYEKMAEQLVIGSLAVNEVMPVLADNYSTPASVQFEEDLKEGVNRRLHRLAVPSVVRLDSRSSDGLQVVDLFTSAVAYEFRESAGLTTAGTPKAQLAEYVRNVFGCSSFIGGWQSTTNSHSVREYQHGRWVAP